MIHNCKGELLDIVSSTIPLLAGSEVVGAMTSTIFYDKYRAGKGLPKRVRESCILWTTLFPRTHYDRPEGAVRPDRQQ